MQPESSYICPSCGEEIHVPVDLSQGERQSYTEDCPVCCRPVVIHLVLDAEGGARSWAEPE